MLNNTNKQLRTGWKREVKFTYKGIPGHEMFVCLHQWGFWFFWTSYSVSKQYYFYRKCCVCVHALNCSSPREQIPTIKPEKNIFPKHHSGSATTLLRRLRGRSEAERYSLSTFQLHMHLCTALYCQDIVQDPVSYERSATLLC